LGDDIPVPYSACHCLYKLYYSGLCKPHLKVNLIECFSYVTVPHILKLLHFNALSSKNTLSAVKMPLPYQYHIVVQCI